MKQKWQILPVFTATVALATILLSTACSPNSVLKYVTPDAKMPAPTSKRFKKDFFITFDEKNKKIISDKKFLCGWATEHTSGNAHSSFDNNYSHAGHCNVVFEITEHLLIAKEINPSFPVTTSGDRSSSPSGLARWRTLFTIPITKHYYLEKYRDSRGRETNEVIENDTRSDWTARPYINLELGGFKVKDWFKDFAAYYEILSVDSAQINLDEKTGWFGFTADINYEAPRWWNWWRWYGSADARVRFNLLRYETASNADFQPTYWDSHNAKYLNVLWVAGRYVDGLQREQNLIQYAAKWNVGTKTKPKKIDFYLHGFPKEFEYVGRDIIELWNNEFEAILGVRPFVIKISQREHWFDLRYPTINWVDDLRMSSVAGLGVAMTNADVTNGEILWGGVTLWGGNLKSYLNSYVPAAEILASEGGPVSDLVQTGLITDSIYEHSRQMRQNDIVPNMSTVFTNTGQVIDALEANRPDFQQRINEYNQAVQQRQSSAERSDADNDSIKEPKTIDIAGLQFLNPMVWQEYITNHLRGEGFNLPQEIAQELLAEQERFRGQFSPFPKDFIQTKILQQPTLEQSLRNAPEKIRLFFDQPRASKIAENVMALGQEASKAHGNPHTFDLDRNVGMVSDAWAYARAKTNTLPQDLVPPIAKDILLHEFGHAIGLGHNFKENILPELGSVPAKYIKGDPNAKPIILQHGLEKRAKEMDFTNYTTVMGYKHGITDVLTPYEELTPGPHDRLVLSYLYKRNRSIPVFYKNPTDIEKNDLSEDFKWVDLASDGIIRSEYDINGRIYRPAYFPHCNDGDASWQQDPFCHRWDRGYNAETIVDNLFEDFNSSLVTSLYAFSDTVGSGSEAYVWWRALDTFTKARAFYDEMRLLYKDIFDRHINTGGEQGIKNLVTFSESCDDTVPMTQKSNQKLAEVLNKSNNAKLKDLCKATRSYLKNTEFLLSLRGTDHTEYDRLNRYATSWVPSGDISHTDNRRAFGTWTRLSQLPIKIPALMTLTSPFAPMYYWGWLFPNPRYADANSSYSVSTLFPNEFASTIYTTVESNLQFANQAYTDRTIVGRTLLAIGYFLWNQRLSNDVLDVDEYFIKSIREQTEFDYGVSFLTVSAQEIDGKDVVRKFNAKLDDWYNRKTEDVPSYFVYPNNRSVVLPPTDSLLMPLNGGKIRFYRDTEGYFYSIKLNYTEDQNSRFKKYSISKLLEREYMTIMNECIEGTQKGKDQNGLKYFFNDNNDLKSLELFPGFEFPKKIHLSSDDQDTFHDSVIKQFIRYYSDKNANGFAEQPNAKTCEEALRGQGLIVMAAAVIDGYFPQVIFDYIEKAY